MSIFPPKPAGQPLVHHNNSSSGYYPDMAWNIDFKLERRLPVRGEVLVTEGQRVESDTIVARTLINGTPQIFNLAAFFETDSGELKKLLVKTVGDQVEQNEVLAQRKGFWGRQFKAPFAATISAFDPENGYLGLTPLPAPFNLDAYVQGVVNNVVPGYGINLGLHANYVRGAFGFGGEQHGVLKVLSIDPQEPVDPAQIEARASFFILLGGSYIRAEALRKAVEMKVRGIICGSIKEEELTKFLEYRRRSDFYRIGSHEWRFPADLNGQDSPLTLVVTEGFGQRPMASPVFEMLLSHDGQPLSINGTTRLRSGVQRPEIVIPISTPREAGHFSTSLNPEERQPRPGSVVRLINPSYLGAVGHVRNLNPSRHNPGDNQFERQIGIEVNGNYLLVPISDLEVLQF